MFKKIFSPILLPIFWPCSNDGLFYDRKKSSGSNDDLRLEQKLPEVTFTTANAKEQKKDTNIIRRC